MDEVAAAPQSPLARFRLLPRTVRSLIAIGATALWLWFAITTVTRFALVALFTVPPLALVIALVAPVVLAVGVSFLAWLCTGKRHVLASAVVALAALGLQATWYVEAATIPIWWVDPGFELTHLIAATIAALMLGLFLGPLWVRIVGAAAAIGCVALVAALFVSMAQPSAAELAAVDQGQAQMDANFEYYIDSGQFPYTSDAPGVELVNSTNYGPTTNLLVTPDGGVVEIVTDRTALEFQSETWACMFLAWPDMGPESTDTMADYADWCVVDGVGWARVDELGAASVIDGALVAVKAAIEQNVELAKGDRPANAREVAEVASSLRMMTEAEVRAFTTWP